MDFSQKIRFWLHNLRVNSWLAHADTAFTHGDLMRAIRLCTRVILDRAGASAMQRAEAFALRGRTYHRQGDDAAALRDYDAALALDPRSSALHMYRGLAAIGGGDYAEALASFNLAVYYNPRDAAAHINRGLVNELMGNLSGAIAEYTAAIHLNPHIDFAYTNRGAARALWGDLRGAIADYQVYLALGGGWRYGDQSQIESRIESLKLQLESGT